MLSFIVIYFESYKMFAVRLYCWIFGAVVFMCFIKEGNSYDGVISIYTNQTNSHLAVNKHTGHVYVGATNRIFQFTSRLQAIGVHRVGPFEDSNACFGYRDRICPSEDTPLEKVDNHNKILLIDYDRGKLIHCGSVFQGICWIVGLDNISNSEIDIVDRPVVSNDNSSSTVGFIAPGPPDPSRSKVRN